MTLTLAKPFGTVALCKLPQQQTRQKPFGQAVLKGMLLELAHMEKELVVWAKLRSEQRRTAPKLREWMMIP
jgi:hypothetical protein